MTVFHRGRQTLQEHFGIPSWVLSAKCKHPTIRQNEQQPARSELVVTFGERVRQLRHAKGWSLRDLAEEVGVGFTYLSRVENERLNFGDYPSDALIHRLAEALDANEDVLLILAKRIPEPLKKRILQRPDAFRAFASCDDATLDKLMVEIGQTPTPRKAAKNK
jgi:transcriptional regulator with XRE-family HTH domain